MVGSFLPLRPVYMQIADSLDIVAYIEMAATRNETNFCTLPWNTKISILTQLHLRYDK